MNSFSAKVSMLPVFGINLMAQLIVLSGVSLTALTGTVLIDMRNDKRK